VHGNAALKGVTRHREKRPSRSNPTRLGAREHRSSQARRSERSQPRGGRGAAATRARFATTVCGRRCSGCVWAAGEDHRVAVSSRDRRPLCSARAQVGTTRDLRPPTLDVRRGAMSRRHRDGSRLGRLAVCSRWRGCRRVGRRCTQRWPRSPGRTFVTDGNASGRCGAGTEQLSAVERLNAVAWTLR
jgi:hypothetical protein